MKLENEYLNKQWSDYNQIRLSGNKKLANKLLDIFIESILLYDEYVIEDFVYKICSIVLENEIISNNGTKASNSQFRIQHPLFQKVILPTLIKKYKENDPLYIRWIAQFEQFFYSDRRTTNYFLEKINDKLREAVQFSAETNQYENIKCRYFSTKYFLIKSFELEPTQATLHLILKRLAQDIYYQTHELPSAILADADDFMKEIKQFKYYYEKYNNKNKWKKQVQEWTDVGNHWKTYSTEQNKFKSFEEYLAEMQHLRNSNITLF